jgi:hypothetical protein
MLVRNAHGVELLSNVCRHRQAMMLNGRGNAQNIVCPIHRWTYDLKGELLGAPHFDGQAVPEPRRTPLQNWNGLLFDGPRDVARDLAALGVARLRLLGLHARPRRAARVNYNWKTFIEVYLEDYHVGPFHPGLGQFVTCDDLAWEFGDWYSVQTVGTSTTGSPSRARRTYERWHKAVLDYYRGELPRHGAVWLTYYPNIMLEWYPHVLVVSHALPGDGTARSTSSSSTIRRRSRCSSASSSRPSRPRTWRPRGGRRDRASAWTPAARAAGSRPQRGRALPVADGRRHAALPRVLSARRERLPIATEVPAPGAGNFQPAASLTRSVGAPDIEAALGGPARLVIDARAGERYRGEVEPMDPVAGHIPGALNRPFAGNLRPDGRFKPGPVLRGEFDALLGGRDPASVVHQCGSGVTACHNLLAMAVAGHPETALYPGSWSEWCSDPARPVARGSA